jgi:hypothetical protein
LNFGPRIRFGPLGPLVGFLLPKSETPLIQMKITRPLPLGCWNKTTDQPAECQLPAVCFRLPRHQPDASGRPSFNGSRPAAALLMDGRSDRISAGFFSSSTAPLRTTRNGHCCNGFQPPALRATHSNHPSITCSLSVVTCRRLLLLDEQVTQSSLTPPATDTHSKADSRIWRTLCLPSHSNWIIYLFLDFVSGRIKRVAIVPKPHQLHGHVPS